ncbi:MAG: hypothetical protein K0Q51_113 [Rickettsiaceae bacterium]|jgi:hypothetical protein|nr:hypothetical protein [Rickettsiaceae bacterium]
MSFSEKLQKLQEEQAKLIEKRQQEILKIIADTGALDIDNKTLTSLLLFLKKPENKEHPFVKELTTLNAAKKKTPSRVSKEAELISA